ncbi:uncharacterized protein A4U43_C06F13270 [Asparagus officinalis]|uniref:Uncharacterized protein n=1 Tax=Asparagus officinalis TaxID=4686 RepID=A0A5P1ES74_ASPOF|nr:uncharacterized protein A4U43_C06F13270 [Asparagus officinalis]
MPSNIRLLARFGVASVGGKLFVHGGESDRVDPSPGIFVTTEVWSYDPITREWARRENMHVPRAMFACWAIDGRIIVAGGFTSFCGSISNAEIYDPESDTWSPLPDLCQIHTSACSGIVIQGKMHVVHKGLSTVQILKYKY